MIARIKRRAKQRNKQYRRAITVRYPALGLIFFRRARWPRRGLLDRNWRCILFQPGEAYLSDDFIAQYTSDATTGSAH
jgi:hypothetical protein